MLLLSSEDFFSKLKKKKKKKYHHFQETYQSVESFGSRPGPTCCWFWSGSKLFAKVISRRSKENVERCKRNKNLVMGATCHAVCFLLSKSHGKTLCCHTVRRCAITR